MNTPTTYIDLTGLPPRVKTLFWCMLMFHIAFGAWLIGG
jgi:hypothetical protein